MATESVTQRCNLMLPLDLVDEADKLVCVSRCTLAVVAANGGS